MKVQIKMRQDEYLSHRLVYWWMVEYFLMYRCEVFLLVNPKAARLEPEIRRFVFSGEEFILVSARLICRINTES